MKTVLSVLLFVSVVFAAGSESDGRITFGELGIAPVYPSEIVDEQDYFYNFSFDLPCFNETPKAGLLIVRLDVGRNFYEVTRGKVAVNGVSLVSGGDMVFTSSSRPERVLKFCGKNTVSASLRSEWGTVLLGGESGFEFFQPQIVFTSFSVPEIVVRGDKITVNFTVADNSSVSQQNILVRIVDSDFSFPEFTVSLGAYESKSLDLTATASKTGVSKLGTLTASYKGLAGQQVLTSTVLGTIDVAPKVDVTPKVVNPVSSIPPSTPSPTVSFKPVAEESTSFFILAVVFVAGLVLGGVAVALFLRRN